MMGATLLSASVLSLFYVALIEFTIARPGKLPLTCFIGALFLNIVFGLLLLVFLNNLAVWIGLTEGQVGAYASFSSFALGTSNLSSKKPKPVFRLPSPLYDSSKVPESGVFLVDYILGYLLGQLGVKLSGIFGPKTYSRFINRVYAKLHQRFKARLLAALASRSPQLAEQVLKLLYGQPIRHIPTLVALIDRLISDFLNQLTIELKLILGAEMVNNFRVSPESVDLGLEDFWPDSESPEALVRLELRLLNWLLDRLLIDLASELPELVLELVELERVKAAADKIVRDKAAKVDPAIKASVDRLFGNRGKIKEVKAEKPSSDFASLYYSVLFGLAFCGVSLLGIVHLLAIAECQFSGHPTVPQGDSNIQIGFTSACYSSLFFLFISI